MGSTWQGLVARWVKDSLAADCAPLTEPLTEPGPSFQPALLAMRPKSHNHVNPHACTRICTHDIHDSELHHGFSYIANDSCHVACARREESDGD